MPNNTDNSIQNNSVNQNTENSPDALADLQLSKTDVSELPVPSSNLLIEKQNEIEVAKVKDLGDGNMEVATPSASPMVETPRVSKSPSNVAELSLNSEEEQVLENSSTLPTDGVIREEKSRLDTDVAEPPIPDTDSVVVTPKVDGEVVMNTHSAENEEEHHMEVVPE